ncbi:MAG: hypothetical protein LBC03_06310 [Nitrososphaerota archaeon]|jgi:hypothetical protein|nr:hypothetical protein [Nitrososphaerota archaeon]
MENNVKQHILTTLALVAGCFVSMPLTISHASAQLGANGTWSIDDHYADLATEMPERLFDGSVWTDKSVKVSSFNITLIPLNADSLYHMKPIWTSLNRLTWHLCFPSYL